MRIKKNFTLRVVADDYLVVPLEEEADRVHGIITLNESGAFLWKCMEIDQTEDTLVDELMKEYYVDRVIAHRDVKTFLSTIERLGCVEE